MESYEYPRPSVTGLTSIKRTRKVLRYNPETKQRELVYGPTDTYLGLDIVAILEKHGAFDFVNNGELAEFQDLPIYLLHNKHTEEGLAKNGQAYPFLAVRVDKPTDTTITINGLHFQLVGALGMMDQRLDQRNEITLCTKFKKALNESGIENEEWETATQLTVNIGSIMPGLFVKDEAHDITHEWLSTQPDGTQDASKEQPLSIVVHTAISTHVVSTENIKERDIAYNGNEMPGSVWMLTKGADGMYHKSLIQMKMLHEYDYEGHKDTTFVRRLVELADILCDTEADKMYRLEAKITISRMIYCMERDEDGLPIVQMLFGKYGASLIGKLSSKIHVHEHFKSGEAFVKTIFKLANIYNDKGNVFLPVRISVDKNTAGMYPQEYLNILIESGVMSIRTRFPFLINAGFTIKAYFLDERYKDGETEDANFTVEDEKETVPQNERKDNNKKSGIFDDKNDICF